MQTGEAWPASCGKACGKPEIACQSPREEGNFASYSARAIWSVTQFVCSDRTQCIMTKAIVFIVVSYFEHIFIIIYSCIPLCTILYIPFTYFYNYILFHVSNILSIFTTKLRLRCLFSPYIVSQKCLLQLKFNVITFFVILFFKHVRCRMCTLLVC